MSKEALTQTNIGNNGHQPIIDQFGPLPSCRTLYRREVDQIPLLESKDKEKALGKSIREGQIAFEILRTRFLGAMTQDQLELMLQQKNTARIYCS